jgi:hypothetical protein
VEQKVVPIQKKEIGAKKDASIKEPTPVVEPDENMKPVPLPRNFGTVKVHFTARSFPTPKRESQASEEEEVTRFYKCSE